MEGRIMSITSEVETQPTLFLKARQVRARYGDVSHMWLVRRQKDSGFPSPSFFGGIRFWKLSELERWEADQQPNSKARATRDMKAARAVQGVRS
jgi:hypothetical protein